MNNINDIISKTCCKCNKKEEVRLCKVVEKNYGDRIKANKHYYYRNANLEMWQGNVCYSCCIKSQRLRKGHSDRGESKKKRVIVAVESESAAAKRFSGLGFEVKKGKAKGVDLYCTIKDVTWAVEVKRAVFNSGSWRVGEVCKNRKGDDLVAIVLPNGYVYIDTMKIHLSKCHKHGTRTVTDIVKQYGTAKLEL